jgi:small subunit ribosomal protein S1
VEGLIHVSELSWVKRITRPSDVLSLGQEIEAVVLGIDKATLYRKRRRFSIE